MRSLWKDTAKLPEFSPLEGDVKTDVLVIGGGLTGILTAYALEQAGMDYLLIEARELCSGVTGHTTAKITSQHGLIYQKLRKEFGPDTARLYWQAHEQALERYRTLCQDIPCEFEEKDAYVYSLDRPDKLDRELEVLARLNIPAELVKPPALPFQTAGAIRFRNQAQFHPLKFAAHIAQGLNIRTHTRALAWEDGQVVTDHGSIQAENIVVATHFPLFNKHGLYWLKLYQHRSYVLALEGAGQVDGMYLDEAQGGLSLRNAGGLLLLGGGSHRTGKPGGCWGALETAAKKYYPTAQEKYRWATQDCMSLDGVPYIGNYSMGRQNLFAATGFNKWGMTSAMAASTILCDMVRGSGKPYTGVFSPSRTMLRAQLWCNAGEALKSWLTFTKPRCPHMGCALQWNAQERTWDCPCHGSRFTKDGGLLENPANGDMEL